MMDDILAFFYLKTHNYCKNGCNIWKKNEYLNNKKDPCMIDIKEYKLSKYIY